MEQDDGFIVELKNQCSTCQHLDRTNPTQCAAFPNGIPAGFLMGQFKHPYNYGGVSDHGIGYAPIGAIQVGSGSIFD